MTITDQCPSTHGPKAKVHHPSKEALASSARVMQNAAGMSRGMVAWRSLDEVADNSEFREHVEKEFPNGAMEMQRAFEAGGETRRDFLKIMGGSMAMAGVAMIPGCRRPDHKILTFSKEVPEEVIPGRPLFYATSFHRPDGGVEGLLVETHEGRPTKIEGNPLHPVNNGKVSTWALASIMGMYDPDRLKFPMYNNPKRGRLEATWDDFRAWSDEHFKTHDASKGEHLAFVVEKKSSPTRDSVKKSVMARWPKATWIAHDPTEATSAVEGSKIAFGAPMREMLSISRENTKVIVSLDRDFLYHCPDELPNARAFASTRRAQTTKEDMSRLYVVESGFSTTGAQADHRLRLAPSRVAAFAAALAQFLLPKLSDDAKALASAIGGVAAGGADIDTKFVEETAKDLLDSANRGKTLILAGPTLPAPIHALVHAMNAALGNVGNSVRYAPIGEEEATASLPKMSALAASIKGGQIKTLVCINTNPAYDAPADAEFAAAMATKDLATVTLSVEGTETAAMSTWSLNGAHYLEAWGDTRAADGTIAPIQPMIAPLYEGAMSDIELLAMLGNTEAGFKADGYAIVRDAWKPVLGSGFDSKWRRALHDGLIASTASKADATKVNFGAVGKGFDGLILGRGPGQASLEVVFTVGNVADGRFSNNAWLQELPEVGTRTVWDNPALVSPATAKALGLLPEGYADKDPSAIYTKPKYPMAKKATLTVNGRKVVMPVWILPGMADNTVMVTFGYGRHSTGKVADGVGVNIYPIRDRAVLAAGGRLAQNATLASTGEEFMIASTQNHWSLEGRTSIVRAVDLPAWKKHGDMVTKREDRLYKTEEELNFAEQLGELSHAPPNESIYVNPYNGTRAGVPAGGKDADGNPVAYSSRQQWGMTIDLSTCTGCGTCTVACQSENNIAVVGKKEVAKGREMHWIRVDRYFVSDVKDGEFVDVNEPAAMYHQPVACVHCENAPCETVCPVNATIHGPEGINYMTYNRCIGTRYCANNCPYKVRRYNFFEYGKLAFNGDYIGKEQINKLGDVLPGQGVGPNGSPDNNKININFIPPRLRQKIAAIEQMQKNPDVSVRMRGVMEKCSYCIQRINAARIECKLNDVRAKDGSGQLVIPDGFFQTACQQACPSDAIVFGDINDPESRVHETRNHGRSYALLGFINTRPRTSHMVRVMNPNPALRVPVTDPFHHEGGHNGGHEGHDHEKPGAEKKHTFKYNRNRLREDRGYALSLNVLTDGGKA